jgi:hypothetical protein
MERIVTLDLSFGGGTVFEADSITNNGSQFALQNSRECIDEAVDLRTYLHFFTHALGD